MSRGGLQPSPWAQVFAAFTSSVAISASATTLSGRPEIWLALRSRANASCSVRPSRSISSPFARSIAFRAASASDSDSASSRTAASSSCLARAVEVGVFGYLVKPFRESDLLPAIHTARARHEELAALREEAESLAEALAARKAIERAKGLLMAKEGLTEEEAFARLRKASQVAGRPLKVVAEAVVATLDADPS